MFVLVPGDPQPGPSVLQAARVTTKSCCVQEDTDVSTVGLGNARNDHHLYSNYFAAITMLSAALQLPNNTPVVPVLRAAARCRP